MSEVFLVGEDKWEILDCSESNIISLAAISDWSNSFSETPNGHKAISMIFALDADYSTMKSYRWRFELLLKGFLRDIYYANNNTVIVEMKLEVHLQKKGKGAAEKHWGDVNNFIPNIEDSIIKVNLRDSYIKYFNSIGVRIEP